MTAKEQELLNWTLAQVTKTPRSPDQEITSADLTILKSGKFGDNTTFGLPASITDILAKL